MPILIVLGVSKRKQTERFLTALKQRVYGMKELKLTADEITVKFLGEASDEIIVFVEGFFDKPERTETVRHTLAQRIVLCCKHYVSDASLIECLIKPFDPGQGFYSITQ